MYPKSGVDSRQRRARWEDAVVVLSNREERKPGARFALHSFAGPRGKGTAQKALLRDVISTSFRDDARQYGF